MDAKEMARMTGLIKGRIGDDLLEAGMVSFPVLLLVYQDLLYLSPLEFNVTAQIWTSYWVDEDFPSLDLVATRVGKTSRWVQNVLRDLRSRGLGERAGPNAPAWVERVSAVVQEETAEHCRANYSDAVLPPPFGYLLIIERSTSWGQQEENWYDFFPLLSCLRALNRESIRPLRQNCRGGEKPTSSPHDSLDVGGRSGVHPRGEAGLTPMVMEKKQMENGKAATNSFSTTTTTATTFFDPTAGIRFVLDHFLSRVAERWPTPGQPGQPPELVRQRYEVALALLSPEVSSVIISQAPADVVEELMFLNWVLWNHEPVDLAAAIDRALDQAGASPVRRLAFTWPQMPNGKLYKKRLGEMLSWARTQDSRFREALRLFVCLNRYGVGPLLAEAFLELCSELNVAQVLLVLQQAVRDGRQFITAQYIRKGVSLLGTKRRRLGAKGVRGKEESLPNELLGENADEAAHNGDSAEEAMGQQPGSKRSAVVHALNMVVCAWGSAEDRQNLSVILRRLEETGLGWDTLSSCVAEASKAGQDHPYSGERMRWFFTALRKEVAQRMQETTNPLV